MLAFLIGQSRGRWWPELSGHARECKLAMARLQDASVLASSSSLTPAPQLEGDVVVGVAVMSGWHFVFDVASHLDTHALMQASAAFHRKRSGQVFL